MIFLPSEYVCDIFDNLPALETSIGIDGKAKFVEYACHNDLVSEYAFSYYKKI